MECREFDELIQEMLDCRQLRTLSDDAAVHIGSCAHCRSNYFFYQQLSALTASPSNPHQLFNPHKLFDELATPVGQAVAADGELASAGRDERAEPILAPVLRLRSDRRPFGMWRAHWVSVAALLCLSLAAWQFWPAGGGIDPNSVPMAAESGPVTPPSALDDSASPLTIELASNAVAGGEPKTQAIPTSAFPTPDDLQKLSADLDESVVALDRRWQQMAAGRVRAHQIPGLQPAVYPFTGAVEAFRKTMIVRNQNGVAAGVRW